MILHEIKHEIEQNFWKRGYIGYVFIRPCDMKGFIYWIKGFLNAFISEEGWTLNHNTLTFKHTNGGMLRLIVATDYDEVVSNIAGVPLITAIIDSQWLFICNNYIVKDYIYSRLRPKEGFTGKYLIVQS